MRGLFPGFACLAVIVAACSLEPIEEQTSVEIEFESVDFEGRLWDPFMPAIEEGEPVTINGVLTLPPTADPVPAVILMHGCGGVGGSEWSWVDDLADEGIATFIVYSFRSREIQNICTGAQTINVASPIVDAYRAAELLRGHEYIDGSRIAVMGFSFGGRTAIWSAYTRFQEAYGGSGIQAHVAFYPSTCYIELDREGDTSDAPIRVFHGTHDSWTPIDQCIAMVDRMSGLGVDADVYAYEGAEHSFDNPGFAWAVRHVSLQAVSPRACQFVELDGEIIDPETGRVGGVDSPCVERGITYAYSKELRQAAKADLLDFLSEVFGSG